MGQGVLTRIGVDFERAAGLGRQKRAIGGTGCVRCPNGEGGRGADAMPRGDRGGDERKRWDRSGLLMAEAVLAVGDTSPGASCETPKHPGGSSQERQASSCARRMAGDRVPLERVGSSPIGEASAERSQGASGLQVVPGSDLRAERSHGESGLQVAPGSDLRADLGSKLECMVCDPGEPGLQGLESHPERSSGGGLVVGSPKSEHVAAYPVN